MPPVLTAYTHDDIPAQETWLDCATADGGRLRVVWLTADPQGVKAPTAASASDQNWTRGILQVEEAPLARVVAELARYRRGYLGCAADMAPSQRDHAMKLANALLTGGVSEETLRRADGP